MKLSEKARSISPSLTLDITAKANKMRSLGIDVIGFGAGEPDFDTPDYIKKAAIEAIEKGYTKYTPTSGIIELKEAIVSKLKNDNNLSYETSQIVVSNGAKQSIYNTLCAILNPGDEVLIPSPYWLSYPEMVKLANGVPIFVETDERNNFKVTVEQLEEAISDRTKAIIINSPNNPTGAVYNETELKNIADLAVKHNIFIISDEIYEKLIYDGRHISIASFNDEIKNLTIIINGMSKAYSMTGWRIGYSASNKEIANLISNIQSHMTSNPNTIAQYASVKALSTGYDIIENMVNEFKKRRDYIVERINKINGLTCIKPQGAFYVIVNISKYIGMNISGKIINGSVDFANFVLEKAKVAVIPCLPFGNDNYIRLSYATSIKNIEEGLNRIENLLKNI
ncbi:pyridoxal phosphate-dependent aminotransferase [Thermoanaerobacterium thermosaccharolyticum]|uniref:pyridoxal phosphate-dependent aminotransferase n=1 Tax=Thermoanaerobacterium thermosaccharolyticum TaxID=1517 RepID=UPI001784190F|nr:pyridoxal phosphate-dependent aminotransferase [Thermoanaerobacterium thermosaccharolyticum]MBE0068090.1 pyridoxal phosphate-dependent aminotransferase [Thermoanaerobacterium thermosaccharolyticum]MBE0227834.1 pyridoxal phosphate-dependent aminotransferase [Thermoanaerobacterium thermosaccharolyticum]